jgi:glutathione S-transferase
VLLAMRWRQNRALELLEARLTTATYLAGAEFTVADIMLVFSITTMRYFNRWTLGNFRTSWPICSASRRGRRTSEPWPRAIRGCRCF